MRKFLVWLIPLALALSFSAVADNKDQQRKLEELKNMIEQLQSELKKVKGSRNDLQQGLEKSETEIGSLLKDIEKIKSDLNHHQVKLTDLRKSRDSLIKAKRDQQQHISEQIEAAYRVGQQSNIKLLLNQQSPQRLSRMMKYYDYFLDARADKIDTYIDTITELDQIEPAIAEKTQQLNQSRLKLQQRHRKLNDRQLERKNTLAALNRSIANKAQHLKTMSADRARLQKLFDHVAAAIAALPAPDGGISFAKRRGKLIWPTQGKLRHSFGSSREGTALKWDGMVIAATAGIDVKAVHGGRIIFSDYLRGHGLLAIVDHGHGYMSLYAHNQSLFRETGDWVEAGETIASVGNSGGREQTGLYFEIRKNGKPTNPKRWLIKA